MTIPQETIIDPARNGGSAQRPFDKKLLLVSAAAAGAVAVWANAKGREYTRTGVLPTLINWERARSVALAMNRAADAEAFPAGRTDHYRSLVARCVPLIQD
jgi:hypothetical protein